MRCLRTLRPEIKEKLALMKDDKCYGKNVYTKKEAQTKMNSLQHDKRKRVNRRKAKRVPVRIYHCPTCNGWHLTSKEN